LLVNEYRDGILLFEIMEEKVWGKSLKDTAGLMAHYELIKNNHKWGERAEATIIKISTDKNVTSVEKMLKQGISPDSIARTFNQNNTLEISIESGKYEKTDNAFVDANWGKKGTVRAGKEDGRNILIVFKNYLPADFKKLNEIRGIVTTEYQNKLEREWLEGLQQKYTVKINEEVKSKMIDNLK
jgi:peptidyl-prolyl cis-trans isomerase SurA